MDLAEVHDCFTINQMLCAEAMGLSEAGPRRLMILLVENMMSIVSCPINLSGGLKSKGHPVGATGASMHALMLQAINRRTDWGSSERTAGTCNDSQHRWFRCDKLCICYASNTVRLNRIIK